MKPKKGDKPYIYIYLYSKFKNKAQKGRYIRPKVLRQILRRALNITSTLHYPILSQMEEHKLIKRINQRMYIVLESDCDEILKEFREFSFLE